MAQPAPSASAPAVVAPAAPPPDAARMEVAQQIVQAMKFRETLGKALESDAKTVQLQIDRSAMLMPSGSATPAEIDEYKKKMLDLWTGSFQVDTMVNDTATAYATLFTVDQLKALLAFFSSPTGQVWVEKTPELAKITNTANQTHQMAAMTALRKYDGDFRKAHPAKPATPPAAAAAPSAAAPAPAPAPAAPSAPSAAAGH